MEREWTGEREEMELGGNGNRAEVEFFVSMGKGAGIIDVAGGEETLEA